MVSRDWMEGGVGVAGEMDGGGGGRSFERVGDTMLSVR